MSSVMYAYHAKSSDYLFNGVTQYWVPGICAILRQVVRFARMCREQCDGITRCMTFDSTPCALAYVGLSVHGVAGECFKDIEFDV